MSGFARHLLHDRQGADTRYRQPAAGTSWVCPPGLRAVCVSKGGAQLFGGLLIPLADVAAIDNDVLLIGRSIGSTQRKIPGLQTRNGNRPSFRSDLDWRYLCALFVRLKLRSVRQSLIDTQCLELSRCIGQANQVLLANNTRGDQSRAV
jgi:hypothetical protein